MSNPIKAFYKDGSLQSESWFDENDNLHRVGAPAYIAWHENKILKYEQWTINDKLHRIDGPTIQKWDESGNLRFDEWWINGIELTDKEITVLKRKLKLCQIQ